MKNAVTEIGNRFDALSTRLEESEHKSMIQKTK